MALATYHLTAGTACFHLCLPQGQATNYVKVGALNTQTDVKNTWGDGSIRDCQVSCVVPSEDDYDITAGTAATGSFTPTWPSASVALNIGGTTYTATLPSLTTTDPWFVGPIVKEYRVQMAPVNGATPHGALEVIFDVRSYSEGGHRLGITVQSVKDVAANNAFTYDVVVTIAAATAFSQSGVDHRTMTKWHRAFTTGSPTLSTITPDFEPFHTSYAIPRYDATMSNNAWPATDSLAHARYGITEFGDMSEGMGSPGGRNELAYFPLWWAEYIIHKEADAYAYGIRHAELSGSWSGHITHSDGSSIKRTEDTGYWLDAGNRGGSMSITMDGGFIRGLAESLEINHIPQLCLIPYLLTGDRYFLEQMRSWAHACILMTYQGDGWHGYGIGDDPMWTLLYSHQVRGIAWGLRTVAEAAAFLPAGDDDKAYFEFAVEENLTFLDWVATTLDPGGPLGVPLVSLATGGALTLAVVSWQCDYVCYGVDRCHALGFTPGNDIKEQLATWRVRLLTSGPDFDPQFGAPYWMPFPPEEDGVGTQTGVGDAPATPGAGGIPSIPAGEGRVWLTMAEIFDGNFSGDTDSLAASVYAGEALVGVRIAVQMGLPNADDAYDLLEPAANPLHGGWRLLGVNGSESPPAASSSSIRRNRIRFRA
jgi:hypothetical protein